MRAFLVGAGAGVLVGWAAWLRYQRVARVRARKREWYRQRLQRHLDGH